MNDAVARIDSLRAASRWADAEAAIRAGLAAHPQDGTLLWRLASVLLQSDRNAEGLAAAQAAVAAAPDEPNAHLMHALLLVANKRCHEAVAAGYVVVTLAPEHVSSATTYAFVLQQAGRLADAAAVARHAVTLDPHEPSAHLRLADIASDAGDLVTARRAYEEVLRLAPEHAIARHDLAVLDARTRRPGRALGGLVAAGRLDPANPTVLTTVAAVLWQLSWRLRIGMIVAVVLVVAASGRDAATPSWTTRTVAALVLGGAAYFTWRGARELPAGTRSVVRTALRGDVLLLLTWLAVALCLAVYAAVAVSGVGVLAVAVWPLMILLAVLAVAARIRQRIHR
ncbi:MAG: tetratricopeptide repeat protein [Pseudonocardia sp.]|nr:tetratricopeptide repeat protein [Pseudonocardia sp.]